MESLNVQNGGKRGSSRKGPSKKQLAALAKGRAIRAKNIRNNRSGNKKSSNKKTSQKGGAGHRTRSVSRKAKRNWGKLKAASSANAFISFTKKQVQRKLNTIVRDNRLSISSQQLNELLNANLKKRDHMRGIEQYAAHIAELVKNHSPRTPMNNIQNIYDNIVIETNKKLSTGKQDVLDVSLILHAVTKKVLNNQRGGDYYNDKEEQDWAVESSNHLFEDHPYIGAGFLLAGAAAYGSLGYAVGYSLSGPVLGAIGALVTTVKSVGPNTAGYINSIRDGFRVNRQLSDDYVYTEEDRQYDLERDNLRHGIPREARGPERSRLIRQKSEAFDERYLARKRY